MNNIKTKVTSHLLQI